MALLMLDKCSYARVQRQQRACKNFMSYVADSDIDRKLTCIAKLVSVLLMLPLSLFIDKSMRLSHAPWKAASGRGPVNEQLLASMNCTQIIKSNWCQKAAG